MKYISTRSNSPALTFAEAVTAGMVPAGGLFVPETIPTIDFSKLVGLSYQQIAIEVLTPFMGGFGASEISDCVGGAYNNNTFDCSEVVKTVKINTFQHILELWHGSTAAFKDVALQIMPRFMRYSKIKCGDKSHTMILVATSGDTGKAALEGFKNQEGISIVVFYPHGGVSEVQRLQMVTTDGANTKVIAARGNFDDCQSGVKALFGDEALKSEAAGRGIKFSSANSINWGRLCPQIVYYVKSYLDLVNTKEIVYGDKIDFCVPTGNFGNILAGYYAKEMGLPIRKLICASNRNNVLTDFFKTGEYNRSREFHRTMSPSMDILISSNLERFLFEMTGRNAGMIIDLYKSLDKRGMFSVTKDMVDRMGTTIDARWADEQTVIDTIGEVYRDTGYVLDTHTAVAVSAVNKVSTDKDVPVIITSTASPYKFSQDVLKGLGVDGVNDEFESVRILSQKDKNPVHRAVDGLKDKTVLHDGVIDINDMRTIVRNMLF